MKMVFLQYEPFHEVSNATVLQKISHNDCMCMVFLQYGHDNVSLESCPPNMISHICYRKKVVFLSE